MNISRFVTSRCIFLEQCLFSLVMKFRAFKSLLLSLPAFGSCLPEMGKSYSFQSVASKHSNKEPITESQCNAPSDPSKSPGILLLGCSGVGKTTIHRQLRRLNNAISLNLWLQDSQELARDTAFKIVYLMQELIKDIVDTQGKDAFTESARSAVSRILISITNSYTHRRENAWCFVKEHIDDFKAIWADPVIKHAFSEFKSLYISPTMSYCLDDLDHIMSDDYKSTIKDLLRHQLITHGIGWMECNVNGVHFNVCDVGGTYTERPGWKNCYHDTDTVVFVVALNHFNRILYDPNIGNLEINALQESLDLFENTMKREPLKDSRFVLLFTFKDVFADQIKIEKKSLSECFDDFDFRSTNPKTIRPHIMVIVRSFVTKIADSDGFEIPDPLIVLCALFHGDEVNFAMNSIIDKFKEKIPSDRVDSVSIHSICALDSEEVKEVFIEITSDF